jgi:hydrogenase nickel incorporation protein HypB
VSEGDDKIAKYPTIFQRSDALVITKLDLLSYSNFNCDRATTDMKHLNPNAKVFRVSAMTGDGVPRLADWLVEKCGKESA